MWPDELLCGTGRGRAGASSQPADHAQEAPKEEEAWPSFFSLLRHALKGGLLQERRCRLRKSVAASAARPKDGSSSTATWARLLLSTSTRRRVAAGTLTKKFEEALRHDKLWYPRGTHADHNGRTL